MGQITDKTADTYRDYATQGVPASGSHEPRKADIRAIGALIDNAVTLLAGAFVADSATLVYANRDSLYANLAAPDRSLGIVYNDTAARNGVYVKTGAAGSGSWGATGLLLAGPQGEDGRDLYQIALDSGYIPAGTTEQQFIAKIGGDIAAAAAVAAEAARDAAQAAADEAEAAASLIVLDPNARFGLSIADADPNGRKVGAALDSAGKMLVRSAEVGTLNGRDTASIVRGARLEIVAPYDVGTILVDGQSLSVSGVGGGRGIVPTANGDTWSWPHKVANPAQGSEVPMTSLDPKVGGETPGNANLGVGIHPGHGAVAMLRQLWREEEGVEVPDQPRLYTASNGTGGTPLSVHVAGQTSFETGETQALATRTYARNNARRGRFAMKLMVCTEQDSAVNTSPATYYNQMYAQIAQAEATRYRALAAEQKFDPLLVSSQGASNRGNQRWAIARTIYKLALDHPEVFAMSGPIYWGSYTYDVGNFPNYNTEGLHLSNYGTYLHGAQMGLVGYRKQRGLDVRPIRCVARADDGNTLFLTFALRYGKRLVRGPVGWTTTQPNCGIACFDDANGGAPVAFTAEPSICRDFVTLAFPLGTAPRTGLRIDFGQPAQKMYPYSPGTYGSGYVGAALDLHDDFGLRFRDEAMGIDFPMFDHFPVHSIRLTGAGAGFEITDPTNGG